MLALMPRGGRRRRRLGAVIYAALSHIAVSNALLMSGMFMPKLALAAAALAAAAFFALLLPASWLMLLVGAVSAARSHDPISGERATEKNRST